METQKMTIHRALAELKLIDSKIEKAINLVEPTGLMKLGKPVNGFYSKEDFEKEAKAKYQSVQDLITRKNSIKSAIVKANSITKVIISGKTMTISDAINFKTVIAVKKNLINTLNRRHQSVKAKFNQENEKVNNIALDNAKIMLGKQGDDRVKPNDEDVKNIIEPYIKRNQFHIVDPLNIEKLIEKLQNEVDNFEVEVDAVLSEINAITQIEI
ncbi:hypothetical protein [Tenacibaculum sp. M341]|uniref:hypothetical protein n=1 Tax=Tenacibaculum sp. M341 TaxID=2530339 RepID=UPI00104DC8DA|nr:hypothetical protein [Tenacibaculum sp. M341]TCI90740.1 hypothetical protein EYW44_13545 [Tenacibaculum sp. M341]